MISNRIILTVVVLLFLSSSTSTAQEKRFAFAFYNLENLFDTHHDTGKYDWEYTPTGNKRWTKDRYKKKINNLAFVIDKLGKPHCPEGITILGVGEVENKQALTDLIRNKHIAKRKFGFVHHESPDARGIDVALIYEAKVFKVLSSKAYPLNKIKNQQVRTRYQLLVKGVLNQRDTLHIIVNHWPSRKDKRNVEQRDYAAKLTKRIADSILQSNTKAKIVIMGDFNDNPDNRSCRVILNAKRNKTDVKKGGLYNPMWNIYKKGIGTYCYQGWWNMYDQFIISESLIAPSGKNKGLAFTKAEVCRFDFLLQKQGKYKGYPLRTFSGNIFLNGYSDHLPIVSYFERR
ncbi:putative extracellular nuclease [Dysgonomonas sp. PH5-45]|uniref:endonuclease/exonuclease/phosphatase family protein n=1 Tax=unclassified Dysgonomonas TaxID=2630389 RepID=UPI002473E419|nr:MULTISPECIES: endonuclease/exonuclease/phosphatase family protein [unclassified Dysgonomonas]MDH6354395.1 putative extracellular nuclease [Dysgonomonas sp. PH5-45]MDH6387294.1 putative extracellular nuclease [Dysgonomonas sp. PH5-37]